MCLQFCAPPRSTLESAFLSAGMLSSIDAVKEARHSRCIGERGILHGKVPRMRARGCYRVCPQCGRVEMACLCALRGEAGKEEPTLRCRADAPLGRPNSTRYNGSS